jgi:acyl carrier protein
MNNVLERIISLVSFNTNIEAGMIASDTDFESLGFDSLSLMEMAVAIQREFGVDVAENELAMCDTVGELAATVAGVVQDA